MINIILGILISIVFLSLMIFGSVKFRYADLERYREPLKEFYKKPIIFKGILFGLVSVFFVALSEIIVISFYNKKGLCVVNMLIVLAFLLMIIIINYIGISRNNQYFDLYEYEEIAIIFTIIVSIFWAIYSCMSAEINSFYL